MKPEDKYDIAYQNEQYQENSVGMNCMEYVMSKFHFDTVLDVGCGVGYTILAFLFHHKKVAGIETCDYLLKTTLKTYARMGIVKKAKIQEIPFEDNKFDLVYCTDVLEHIPEADITKSIEELIRVSKKYIFVTICVTPAVFFPELKLHETVKPAEWWREKFNAYRLKTIYKSEDPNGVIYAFQKY